MEQLPKKIHDKGISYTLVGDYYIPNLSCPTNHHPIGRWGQLHREYLKMSPSPKNGHKTGGKS